MTIGEREKKAIKQVKEIYKDTKGGSWHKKCPDSQAHIGLGTTREFLRSITKQIIQGKRLSDKQYSTIEEIRKRYEVIKELDQKHPEGTREEAIRLLEEIIERTEGKTNNRSIAARKAMVRDALDHLKSGDYLWSRSLYHPICMAESALEIKGTDLEIKIKELGRGICEREYTSKKTLYPFGQGGR